MRLYKRNHPARVLPLEIAPMIDVVFLLIIFFMATAQFARLTRAEVNLPREQGEQEKAPEEAGIVVNITREGLVIISDEQVELVDLRRYLRQEMARRNESEVKFLLRADREADSAVLNQVVTQLQQLGLGSARIATEVPMRGRSR
jgi:biopolymer transport protein ExbD